MPKPRINKFIFQDGKVFVRLKTTARDLKLKKVDTKFTIDFKTHPGAGPSTSVAVEFVENVDSETLPEGEIATATHNWGELKTLTTAGDEPKRYYYATPSNQAFMVKFGPLPPRVSNEQLEIDWENMQWGIE